MSCRKQEHKLFFVPSLLDLPFLFPSFPLFRLLFLSIPLLIFFTGCGKKGLPLPIELVTPGTTTDFNIEGRMEGLLISWRNPVKNSDGTSLSDLAGFKLYKKSDSKECKRCPSAFPLYKDIDVHSAEGVIVKNGRTYFLDRDVKEGVNYFYKIAAYNRNGYLGNTTNTAKNQWQEPLPPVEEIKAAVGDRSVTLVWKAVENNDSLVGYRLYRSEVSGNYGSMPISKTNIESLTYTDIGIQNNRQYYYIVKSLTKIGNTLMEGASSAEVLAIPIDMIPPAVPKGGWAAPDSKAILLSWESGSDKDLAGYNVYRKMKGDIASDKININLVKESRYFDSDIVPGKSYVYVITSVDSSPQKNESTSSFEVKIRVPE